jgi:hypothetical protein
LKTPKQNKRKRKKKVNEEGNNETTNRALLVPQRSGEEFLLGGWGSFVTLHIFSQHRRREGQ